MISLTLDNKFNQKLENLPQELQNLTLGWEFNQKLENLPNELKSLTLGDNFNQKLENLPNGLKNLTLGNNFNQKLENLPVGLENLSLGPYFNQKLDVCVALPKLKSLKIYDTIEYKIPNLFDVEIQIIDFYSPILTKINITKEKYSNFNKNEWKNIFFDSIELNNENYIHNETIMEK